MTTLAELIAQRDALNLEIETRQQAERTDAIAKIKSLMATFGITEADLTGGNRTAKVKATSKVAAKYRDPVTGKEWTGRGMTPKWLQGKDKALYLIK